MNDRVMQFRVGVMVLASALIAAILIVLHGDFAIDTLWTEKQTIHVRFDNAPGVTKDTPVRKNGILIGRVTDVQLQQKGVLVTVEVELLDGEGRLRHDELCQITGNLLGDATLDFVPGGAEMKDRSFVQPGETIQGQLKQSPLDVLSDMKDEMKDALVSMKGAGDEVSKLAGRVNTMLGDNDQQFADMLKSTASAMEAFHQTLDSVNDVIGDKQVRDDLRRSLASLPKVLDDTHRALSGMEHTLALANENLTNLKDLTGPLGKRGDSIARNIDQSVGRLDELLEQLALFGQAMNSRDGSLGQFVHNPELYQRINRAADNIERLTQEIRPVIHNARVFTDKIAREPGRLGVQGALRRPSRNK